MQAITREQVTDRMQRGMDMARTDLAGAERRDDGTIAVPSSRGGKVYVVDLSEGSCSCPDAYYRRSASGKGIACKHLTTARIFDELFPLASESSEDRELTRLSAAIETARQSGDLKAEEDAHWSYVYRLDALGKGQTEERMEAFGAAIEALQRRASAEKAKMTAEERQNRYVPEL